MTTMSRRSDTHPRLRTAAEDERLAGAGVAAGSAEFSVVMASFVHAAAVAQPASQASHIRRCATHPGGPHPAVNPPRTTNAPAMPGRSWRRTQEWSRFSLILAFLPRRLRR